MLKLSMYNAFREGSSFFPYIFADVTDDSRGKSMSQLNSYVAVVIYSYTPSGDHGRGAFLGGTLGSSLKGTHTISDNYEAIGFVRNGKDGSTGCT